MSPDKEADSDQIALFRSLIKSRKFDDITLCILESVLVSRDVKSLLEVRSSLREFMRHESLCVLREIEEKSDDHKLLVVEFFVRAFALAGDVESCLALRYEALVLRELKSTSDHKLRVSHIEWITFAEHALENRFFAIARKACEKALLCFQANHIATPEADTVSENVEVVEKINRLGDVAMEEPKNSVTCYAAVGKSVQAQAAEYLKRKTAEHRKDTRFVLKDKQPSASILFRRGIKQRNITKLQERQRL